MASLTPSDNGENNEPPRICEVQEAADSESRPRATPQEEKKEKGGYECEFVEPPKELQSECSICLLILREPQIVSCCGHSFCKTCIGRVQRDGKPCPLCNEPDFTTVANGGLKRSLNEFQVRCPHRELGCEWVGELGKLDQHLNADPQPERQLEGCPFTSVECIHCKNHMRRHVIAGHQNERCPKRPYSCEYCEEYESTFEDVANHWAECKCYLLPCPNNCQPSGSGIERRNLEQHMKEECPLTVVECDFHYAGCGVKLPRKDMAGHMKEESMAHISLLAAENQRLAKQLLERDEKMQQLQESVQQLTQQNTELSNRVDHQEKAKQEQQQELSQIKDSLQQQHSTCQEIAEKTDQQQEASQELGKELTQVKETLQRAQRELAEKTTVTNQQQKASQEVQGKELALTMQQQQATLLDLASKVAVLMQGQQHMERLGQRQQIVPIDIKMAGYKELKDKNIDWYSSPFYTHMCGYKMCLNVDANGCGAAKGTHVSMFTYFMRGEFDSELKWPFQGAITIQLLNQLEDREHYTQTSRYTDRSPDNCTNRVTKGEKAQGCWKTQQFIPHSQLNFDRAKNCQYLKKDCLIFRVLSVDVQQ